MIPSEIDQVIKSHQREAPVNLLKLANALGISVWESPKLEKGVSGLLKPDGEHGGKQGFSILVNGDEPFARKRFTIAHEIAHFILHRNLIGEGLADNAWYRSGLPSLEEAQANNLAAEILMPKALLNRYQAQGVTDLKTLAQRFEVPVPALKVRLGIK